MPIEIPNDSNHAILTQFRQVVGTAMVPLLKPIGFQGKKTSSTKVEVPPEIEEIAKNNFTKVFKKINEKHTGTGGVLAVLDSGVYADHPDFGGRVIISTNYKGQTTPGADIRDLHGHGTHVAGLAAAGRSARLKNFSGIAPNAEIVSIKVTEGASDTTSWKKIADALTWVLDYNESTDVKPYKKISCVLICFNGYDSFSAQQAQSVQENRLLTLFQKCYNSNVVVVVSSGNHYLDFCQITPPARTAGVTSISQVVVREHTGLAYPAVSKYVIAAGATANDNGTYQLNRSDMPRTVSFAAGDMAIFSQRSRSIQNSTIPDPFFVCVPGMQMVSLDNTPEGLRLANGDYAQGYTVMSGTSQAAAILAGMVLLLQEAFRKKYHTVESRVPIAAIFAAINAGSASGDFDSVGHTRNTGTHAALPQFKIFNLNSAITHL